MKMPGSAKNLFLLCAGILFFLFLAAILLRFYDPAKYYFRFSVPEMTSPGYQFDPILFWKLKPNFKGQQSINHRMPVVINSHGMRNREVTVEKPKETFRIISMGDSSTFGWGIPEDKTYSRVLEDLLKKNHRDFNYEVINAGVPGYSSHQGLQYLKRDLIKYKPDLVLVYFGANDTVGARYYSDKNQKLFDMNSGELNLFIHKIKSLFSLVKGWKRQVNMSGIPFTSGHFRVSPNDYKSNLFNMEKLGKENNFRLFIIMPVMNNENHLHINPFWLSKEFTGPNEPMFDKIDLYNNLVKLETKTSDLFADLVHPTILGHKIYAQIIYAYLLQRHVLSNE